MTIPPPAGVPVDLDKNWTARDNTPTSPFFGNRYTEFDNFAQGDVVYMSTSSDGGQTWGVPKTTPSKFVAIVGQPVVQPSGTVVVPIEGFATPRIFSFVSTDGGASWSNPVAVDRIQFHKVAGNLPDLTTAIRRDRRRRPRVRRLGRLRLRARLSLERHRVQHLCRRCQLVGQGGVPIDHIGVGDHFIPGIAVNRATSGATAQIGLSYYWYPVATVASRTLPRAC